MDRWRRGSLARLARAGRGLRSRAARRVQIGSGGARGAIGGSPRDGRIEPGGRGDRSRACGDPATPSCTSSTPPTPTRSAASRPSSIWRARCSSSRRSPAPRSSRFRSRSTSGFGSRTKRRRRARNLSSPSPIRERRSRRGPASADTACSTACRRSADASRRCRPSGWCPPPRSRAISTRCCDRRVTPRPDRGRPSRPPTARASRSVFCWGRWPWAVTTCSTVFPPPEIELLGPWLEQLIAESTGKHGKGILPIAGEERLERAAYGRGRALVEWSAPVEGGPSDSGVEAQLPTVALRAVGSGRHRRRDLPLGAGDRGGGIAARRPSVRPARRRRREGGGPASGRRRPRRHDRAARQAAARSSGVELVRRRAGSEAPEHDAQRRRPTFCAPTSTRCATATSSRCSRFCRAPASSSRRSSARVRPSLAGGGRRPRSGSGRATCTRPGST